MLKKIYQEVKSYNEALENVVTISMAKFNKAGHITMKHSAKMSDLRSISTDKTTNTFCECRSKIEGCVCQFCFVNALIKQYASKFILALRRNNDLLGNGILQEVPKVRSKSGYFRFEAFGDLMPGKAGLYQFVNYCLIAANNPEVNFALWTKNTNVVIHAFEKFAIEKPSNLNLIKSSSFVNVPEAFTEKEAKYFDKVFTVYDPEGIEANNVTINCGGKSCASCGICYTLNNIVNVNEKLK